MAHESKETGGRDPYRELFERSADAILIIEGETFIDCNQAAVEMLRYENKADVLKTHPSELSPPTQPDGRDSFEKANELIAKAFEQGSQRFEWDHVRADGEVFPVEVLLTAVQEESRQVLHVVWRDITERKRLEDQLRHSQKMEAIGKLTGGIAHDFNNLLVAVIGNSDLLEALLRDQPEALEHVREIRDAGQRAAELVRQLLAFGRKQQLLPTALDLRELVPELRRLLERVLGDDVQLVTDVTDRPLVIEADRTQIEQVLLNLATNARDAMPDGGTLTIAAKPVHIDEGSDTPAGDYAGIVIQDSGIGMDTETAKRAFEPFFTTKPLGEGTGLGLATVYGIVTQSGGSVHIDSEPGAGTRIEILLPLSTARVVEAVGVPPPTPKPARGGHETILVAEDDKVVAKLVLRALEDSGYEVILGRDGLEALALYDEHKERISLVLSDVMMPRMGGPQFIGTLHSRGEDPRVLFMSGYAEQSLSKLHDLEKSVDVLAKPFEMDELRQRVRRALDQPRAAS